jgi:CheY-specific phosphatase CheX
MSSDSNISLVTKNTVCFAENVCETLRDMIGSEYKMYSDVFTDNEISLQQGFLVLIPFSGRLQGNFYLCMEEIVVAGLCGMYQEGMSTADLHKLRSDYSSFMLEVINISAAKAISKLESEFRPLYALPPYVIYGNASMPNVTSGDIMIKGEKGTIQCALSIDLAKLKNEEKSTSTATAGGTPAPGATVRKLKSEEIISIGKLTSKINELLKNVDSIMNKSKLAFLEGANQSLSRLINPKDGTKNPKGEELMLEYQLVEKGWKTDNANIREEMAQIESATTKIKETLTTCLQESLYSSD